jgi:hypothetical protein
MPKHSEFLLWLLPIAACACLPHARGEASLSAMEAVDFAPPEGATARCRDGHYSFALERRATCSRHGGVVAWLKEPSQP